MSLRFSKIMEDHSAVQMNPLQLAYLGDVVWEMIVRYDLTIRKYNVNHMHKESIKLVNAHTQAEILHLIESNLSSTEKTVHPRNSI